MFVLTSQHYQRLRIFNTFMFLCYLVLWGSLRGSFTYFCFFLLVYIVGLLNGLIFLK